MKLCTLCYIRDNDKTLMLHRTKKQNDLSHGKRLGIGGKVDENESPKQCAIREIKEEAGLTAIDPILKGICTFTGVADGHTRHACIYRVDTRHGELIDCPEGELHRIETAKLHELPMRPSNYRFLELLDTPHTFSACVDETHTYTEFDMW